MTEPTDAPSSRSTWADLTAVRGTIQPHHRNTLGQSTHYLMSVDEQWDRVCAKLAAHAADPSRQVAGPQPDIHYLFVAVDMVVRLLGALVEAEQDPRLTAAYEAAVEPNLWVRKARNRLAHLDEDITNPTKNFTVWSAQGDQITGFGAGGRSFAVDKTLVDHTHALWDAVVDVLRDRPITHPD